jgi:hypothetical protein
VAAAAHRHDQIMLAGQPHRVNDVGCSGAANDQCRTPVDHAIPHGTRVIVGGVLRADQLAAQLRRKLLQDGTV